MEKYLESYEEHFKNNAPVLIETCLEEEQDIILWHISLDLSMMVLKEAMAERCNRRKVLMANLLFVPYRSTSAFPPPNLDPHELGEDAVYSELWDQSFKLSLSPVVHKCAAWMRERLGLPQREELSVDGVKEFHRTTPILHAYSELILPFPEDWSREIVHCCGYLTMSEQADSAWHPPAELIEFLEGGGEQGSPVYIGFGSMIHADPGALLDTCLRAIASSGVRAVICEGWFLLRKPDPWHPDFYGLSPDQVMFVHDVPHSFLLPRCRCSVVHGGAGTTAAAIRAGKPVVFVPFLIDQPVRPCWVISD